MKKALLVIDVQNSYTNPVSQLFCQDHSGTLENINTVIAEFEKDNDPIIYIRHIHKADGSDLGRMFDFAGPVDDFDFKENTEEIEYDKRLNIVAGSLELVKNRYSAFVGTELENYLKKNGITNLIIVGFMTNFCCESTAREAHDKDYFVDVIIDATGAPALSDELTETKIREIVGEFLTGGFARVMTTSEYLKK